MSKKIKKLYKDAGLNVPRGKGIHTVKFHKCVVGCKVRKGKSKKPKSCYAVCMSSLGKKKAVKKKHWR